MKAGIVIGVEEVGGELFGSDFASETSGAAYSGHDSVVGGDGR